MRGSVRRAMSKGLLAALLPLGWHVASLGQEPGPRRYAMSESVVAAALRASGIDVQPAAVHLPLAMTASNSSPALDVVGTERVGADRVRLRLRCARAGECVPFSAVVDLPESSVAVVSVPATAAPATRMAGSGAPGGSSEWGHTLRSNDAIKAPEQSVHVGAHLTLWLEDGQMRIQLPVIAIDTGARGAEVRVSTEDRKKTFQATVLDEKTVRGVVE